MIELFICIALIAMLTALAIPNFLRAKTSSSVSRAKADFQHIAIGLEAYRVDIGSFPWMDSSNGCLRPQLGVGVATLERLTTPIAYVTGSPFWDPFEGEKAYRGSSLEEAIVAGDSGYARTLKQYFYTTRNFYNNSIKYQSGPADINPLWYMLESTGPDKHHHYLYFALNPMTSDTLETRGFLGKTIYDPTNGSTSRGSIWQVGGAPVGNGKSMAVMIKTANGKTTID